MAVTLLALLLIPGPSWWPRIGWWGWDPTYRSDLGAGMLGGLVVGVAVLLFEWESSHREQDQISEVTTSLGLGKDGSVVRLVQVALATVLSGTSKFVMWKDLAPEELHDRADRVRRGLFAAKTLLSKDSSPEACAILVEGISDLILLGNLDRHGLRERRDSDAMRDFVVAREAAIEELRMVAERLVVVDPPRAGALLSARARLMTWQRHDPATLAREALVLLRDEQPTQDFDGAVNDPDTIEGFGDRRSTDTFLDWWEWWTNRVALMAASDAQRADMVERVRVARSTLATNGRGDATALADLQDALAAVLPDRVSAIPTDARDANHEQVRAAIHDSPPPEHPCRDVLAPRAPGPLLALADKVAPAG